MRHSLFQSVLSAVVAAVSTVSAAPVAPTAGEIAQLNSLANNCTPASSAPFDTEAWQVPWLATYSPSGRPGQPVMPYIEFGFFDPNTCFTTNCTRIWNVLAGDTYPSTYVPCDDPEVEFKVVGPYNPHNFTMEIAYSFEDDATNTTVSETGTALFLLTGECGGSGACFWGLGSGNTVYLPVETV